MLSRAIEIILALALFILIILVVLAYAGPKLSDHKPEGGCLTVGCPSRIKVFILEDAPSRYEFIMSSGFSRVSFECENNYMVPGSYQRINAGSGVYVLSEDVTGCIDGGVVVNQFVPRRFSVTIKWDGGEKTEKYRPKYEWCDGTCCMCGTFAFWMP
jgi:hypothetical protein